MSFITFETYKQQVIIQANKKLIPEAAEAFAENLDKYPEYRDLLYNFWENNDPIKDATEYLYNDMA